MNREADERINNLVSVLKALANPIRIKILIMCAEKEKTNRELRDALGISKPLLIVHLKELVKNGLLTYRVELDEDEMLIKKYYTTTNFNLVINPKTLKKLLRK